MQVDVVSIFPAMFSLLADFGVVSRALKEGIWGFFSWDLRDFAENPHRSIDDRPYGGGPGMVMCPGPIASAVQAARARQRALGVGRPKVVFLSPAGRRFDQKMASDLSAEEGLILVAGRYEGFDERVVEMEADLLLSIGDYILSGGELAAMVVVDAVVRLFPGVVGEPGSVAEESFSSGMLDWPHYTRPRLFMGQTVPDVLLSGHEAQIRLWREARARERTLALRPDLLQEKACET